MAKKNNLKKEYMKQRKRVLNYISRTKKKGYVYDIEIPKIPSIITRKDINLFEEITPQTLRQKGFFVSQETGEAEEAQQAFTRLRSEAAKRGAQTRRRVSPDEWDDALNGEQYVISQFRALFAEVETPTDKDRYYRRSVGARISSDQKRALILQAIDRAIAREGEYSLAHRINENYAQVEEAIQHMTYGYDLREVNRGYNTLLAIINGKPLTLKEAEEIDEADDEEFIEY